MCLSPEAETHAHNPRAPISMALVSFLLRREDMAVLLMFSRQSVTGSPSGAPLYLFQLWTCKYGLEIKLTELAVVETERVK